MDKKITKPVIKSQTSPKNSKRGCLCKDGKKYSVKCCDGSLQAQGIGSVQKIQQIKNNLIIVI